MTDFVKPPNAPSHVTYLLNQSPPKIEFDRLTWAPILLNGHTKENISSGNKVAVKEEFCTLQRYYGSEGDQLAWIFGRSGGHSLLRFHTPKHGGLPDLNAVSLRASIKNRPSYKVRLGGPNVMVKAPDKDLTTYKISPYFIASRTMSPKDLFTEILNKITQVKGKEIRNLVLQSHGGAGELKMFGKRESKSLDFSNVDQFNRLAGKVEAIWFMSCTTCADEGYMAAVVANAEAHVFGSDWSNDQKPLKFKADEIELHENARPVVMKKGETVKGYIGDIVGETSMDLFGNKSASPLAHFIPA